MNKRTLLSLAPVALLSACGFRLRGVPEFGFGSLYIVAPASSPLARELQRTLDGSGSQLKVLRDPASMPTAEAIFDLLQEQQERVVVGLNASGQVRELQLRLRIKFRLRTPTGTMHGSFFCVAEDGEKFDADVPMFVLDALSGDTGTGGKRTLH